VNGWILGGTTFLASAVEFVEAATIVLAVGYAQGWRAALLGTLWATVALGAIVGLFGPLLTNAASLARIQLVIGPFLILFGLYWLRKAVWRYAGRMNMRDEQAIYDRELARLSADRERHLGLAVAFQGVFVEGLEVAIIVVTFGAANGRAFAWASGGALAALVLVTAAAAALHKPFARVPENAMKALVGIMLVSLGTFWTGEALGVEWWAGNAALFALAGAYAAAAAIVTLVLRRARGSREGAR
jgi:Ca2+/H+ antiporter, TMEM165/GDT1 family